MCLESLIEKHKTSDCIKRVLLVDAMHSLAFLFYFFPSLMMVMENLVLETATDGVRSRQRWLQGEERKRKTTMTLSFSTEDPLLWTWTTQRSFQKQDSS